MAITKRLTNIQRSVLQDIADQHLYAADGDMRAVYDSRVFEGSRWYRNPSWATVRSLWRRDLIEMSPEAFIGDSGKDYGHLLRLTPMGRYALNESAPRTFTASWRTEIHQGSHPRKRTRQLKVGDLVLMAWTDGSKEWRTVTGIKPWIASMPDWFEFTTDGSDGQRDGTSTQTHTHSGATRWTVQPASATEGE